MEDRKDDGLFLLSYPNINVSVLKYFVFVCLCVCGREDLHMCAPAYV